MTTLAKDLLTNTEEDPPIFWVNFWCGVVNASVSNDNFNNRSDEK